MVYTVSFTRKISGVRIPPGLPKKEVCGVGTLVVPCLAEAEKGIRFPYPAPSFMTFEPLEISRELQVAKSSVSTWVRDYPLTEEELREKDRTRNRWRAPKKNKGPESKFYTSLKDVNLTRDRKAKIAESAVLFRLAVHGFNVFGSVFDGDRTDWLVETPLSKLVKVQVKWASHKHSYGLPVISLRCTKGHNKQRRYKKGEFDFIVGYDFLTDTAYVFTFDEVQDLATTVTVTAEAAEQWNKLLTV